MQVLITSLFSGLPKEVVTFFIAMVPAFELKASIPVAVLKFNLNPQVALLCSVAGGLVMGILIFGLFRFLFKAVLGKVEFMKRIYKRSVGKLKKKNNKKFEIGEGLLIMLLIIIPLPGFGSFLGALVASILQTKINKMLAYLIWGNFLAGGIVLATLMGLKL